MSIVNLGTGTNTGTGDTLYTAFTAINDKFTAVDSAIAAITLDEDSQGFRSPYMVFVATDGDDTNNGHSFGEPVKTINKAVELANAIIDSEYTPANPIRVLIRVAPGNYTLTSNPVSIRHHVSIMGDALRAVFLYPAQGRERDGFFLVDDAFYMWGLTFKGHQADTEKTGWVVQLDYTADNTTRGADSPGAFITASPYFQNCSSITAEDDAGFAPSVSEGDTGGGILVDGNACADNSPIRSIVLDSFTQVNLGGIGCKVINDGYAQLVSFFGTFCEYHVLCQTGGQVNFTGGTTDFGLYGLVADGYSPKPLFTAQAQRDHYGVVRSDKQATINNTTNVFTSVAHGFTNDAPVTVDISGEDVPAPLSKGTIYYVINATADTFQIALTVGGAAIDITGDTTNFIYNVTTQGELFIDCVSFSESRLGNASQPYNGTLAFPVLNFPRTGSLAADNSTRGIVNVVEQDGNTYTAVAVLDTAPVAVGKHEYVPGTGTVTVIRPGTFVTPDGRLLEVTPVAGLNTYTFNVTSVDYDHLTGITKFTAQDYLPSALDEFYFTNAEFICPLSAYTVTSVQAINPFGLPVAFDDPTAAGFRVNLYNPVNGGLIYPVTLGQKIDFRRRSQISAPSHVSEYVGSGMNYLALPDNGGRPQQANLYQEINNGKVFITYTNEKGDFAVTNRFLVDGTTGEVTINASQFNLSGLNFIGPFSRNGGLTTVGLQIREVSDNPNMISSLGYPDLNTVPTQTAVVGYITRLFTGEAEIEALNVNGVFFTAAPTPADYPLTRPQLVPFSFGDMIWDASKRAWLGWNGTSFSNEISSITQPNGDLSYSFLTSTKPVERPGVVATPIQDLDRWENPGRFVAYYNSNNSLWLDGNSDYVTMSGRFSSTTNFDPVLTGDNYSRVHYSPVTGNYYFFTPSTVYVTSDPQDFANAVQYSAAAFAPFIVSGRLAVNGLTSDGTYIYIAQIDGTAPARQVLRCSLDFSSVQAYVVSFIQRGIDYRVADNRLYLYTSGGGTDHRVHYSTDQGATWTELFASTSTNYGNSNSLYARDNYLLVVTSQNVLIIDYSGNLTTVIPLSGVITSACLFVDNTFYFAIGNEPYVSYDDFTTVTPLPFTFPWYAYRFFKVPNAAIYIALTAVGSTGTLYITPGLSAALALPVQTFAGKFLNSFISLTYSSLSNDHNASNFFTISFTVRDLETDVITTYEVDLNNPYPSTTEQTYIIPVDEIYNFGIELRYLDVARVGTPSSVNVSISMETKRIYD